MLAGDPQIDEIIGYPLEPAAEMMGHERATGQEDQEDGGLSRKARAPVEAAESVGGHLSRTLKLEVGTGAVSIKSRNQEVRL